ncbi:MAG: MFS transporter [Holosporales bacterium]|jgi:sugar phosphate permease|nr:MFS transporter [Holosporales bacterium]
MEKNCNFVAITSISVCWMFYLFSYITRVEAGVIVNELITEFSITASIIGAISSFLYIPYVAMQIPCGIIVDKIGVKNMIIMCSLLCSLGTFIFGSASSILQLKIGRFLIGLSSASAFLSCGKCALEFFDKRKYGVLAGISMFFGCLGGIFGTKPTAILVANFGWRNTTFIIASIGIFIAILAMIFMKKKDFSNTKETKTKPLFEGLKIIAKNSQSWLLGFYAAISYLPLSAIAELWGVPFIEKKYGISTQQAALTPTIIFIGFGIGSIVSAWIAEKINSYKKTLIVLAIGIILSFIAVLYLNFINFYTCLILVFIVGFCAGSNILAFSMACSLVTKEYGGTTTGFINAMCMSSAIVFQPLLGKLLDYFRNGLVAVDGTPIYTIAMYKNTFFFIVIAMFIAIIATFFVDDIKHSQEDK